MTDTPRNRSAEYEAVQRRLEELEAVVEKLGPDSSRTRARAGRRRSKAAWAAIGLGATALMIAPFAVAAGTDDGYRSADSAEILSNRGLMFFGGRNPAVGRSSATTRLSGANAAYTFMLTNQNKAGGGAYKSFCLSPADKNPCMKMTNKNKGEAFRIVTNGALGGKIFADGGDNAKPFTTNATDVATGLNADRVDSIEGSQIVQSSSLAASLTAAFAGRIMWAVVNTDGSIARSSGAASSTHTGTGSYTIVFAQGVSTCSYDSTVGTPTPAVSGVATVTGTAANTSAVGINTYDSAGAATDYPFHLQVLC